MSAPATDHGHRVAELRSIEIHRLVAEKLSGEVLAKANRELDRRESDPGRPGHGHPHTRRWRQLLTLPRAELAKKLIEDSEELRDLRQDTPFAGVLSNKERWDVVRRIKG